MSNKPDAKDQVDYEDHLALAYAAIQAVIKPSTDLTDKMLLHKALHHLQTEMTERDTKRPVRDPKLRAELKKARDELRQQLADPEHSYPPVGKRKRVRL